MTRINYYLFFCVFLLFISNAHAQSIRIRGVVLDASSGEPIPFANGILEGTQSGFSADSSGRFQFQISEGRKRDTLLISAMGYTLQKEAILPMSDQYFTIELSPTLVNLKEAIIRPGENPAFRILRKVIAAKQSNYIETAESYQYECYHKVEFDMNNFTEKTKQNVFLRSFNFIFNNADTTDDGVNYLPILLTESNSEVYYRKQPQAMRELVKARRSVGLKGPKIMKFAEDMYIAPDIYKDYVVVLDKNFPSPLHDNYTADYRYYLIDSLLVEGDSCYYLQFKPKLKEAVAFTGEMYILKNTFALKQIDFSFSISANVNFVRNYWIRQNYMLHANRYNVLSKSQVIGDFTVLENSSEMTGFFGRKSSEYKNYKFDVQQPNEFYKQLDRLSFEDSVSQRSESYWESVRSDSLSKQEKSIVKMMDTLEQQPKYRLLKNGVKSITSGWIPLKQFEIGDFYSFYSYNSVERSRVKLGFRAQQLLYRRLNLKSYLAYGTHDNEFKYLLEPAYILSRKRSKETRIGVKIRKDAMQPGRSSTIFPLDHILNSFTNLGKFTHRGLVNEKEFYLERQWISGFTSRATIFQSVREPFGEPDYLLQLAENIFYRKPSYTQAGFQIALRYAHGERNLSAHFGYGVKASALPEFPVVSFFYEKAMLDFLGGEFNSDKLKLRIESRLRIKKWGYSVVRIEGGMLFGTLPFQFLETPTANPSLFNDETAFNLMNYMEFVSDRYCSGMWEHHFEGIFLNRIPVLKKLKWREVLLGKIYAGDLSQANKFSKYQRPANVETLTKPYLEVGFGIENIFKFSRVDFLWRLSYRDEVGTFNFIAKPMFQFKF